MSSRPGWAAQETTVTSFMSNERLEQQNLANVGTGGCSQGSAALGFRPAFFDFSTGTTYLSRFADGTLAPMHILDGLPETLVLIRGAGGRVMAARSSLIAGFERGGFFFTRTAAARLAADWVAE